MNEIKYHSSSNSNIRNNSSCPHKHQQKVCLLFSNNNFFTLSKILKKYNISTIPLVEKSLNLIFKLGKDFTEICQQTNIIYSFKCKNCPAIYIGETKRSLKTRINEHKDNKK